MKKKWTIQGMLTGLALVCAMAVGVLAFAALSGNRWMGEQQAVLLEDVIPLEGGSRRVLETVQEVFNRNAEVARVATVEEMARIASPTTLLEAYRRYRQQLDGIAEQHEDLRTLLLAVDGQFKGFMDKSMGIYTLKKEILGLRGELVSQSQALDQVVGDLEKVVESLIGKLRLGDKQYKRKLRKALESTDNDALVAQVVRENMQRGQDELQQLASQFRFDVVALVNIVHLFPLARDMDLLRSLRANQFDPQFRAISGSLVAMEEKLAKNTEWQELVLQVRMDVEGIGAYMVSEEASVFDLQQRILTMEKELDSRLLDEEAHARQLMAALTRVTDWAGAARDRASVQSREVEQRSWWIILGSALLAAGLTVGFVVFFIRWLMGRSRHITRVLDLAAQGQYIHRAPLQGVADAFEMISRGVNAMADSLCRNIRLVALQSDTVAACAVELVGNHKYLEESAQASLGASRLAAEENDRLSGEIDSINRAVGETSGKLDGVKWASEQLSRNIVTMAGAAAQTSENVAGMAATAEQMSSNIAKSNRHLTQVEEEVASVSRATAGLSTSLEEVLEKCQVALGEAGKANGEILASQKVMEELSRAAWEINQVVSLIGNIAAQTNMLALNAAIEAAGAGEAGKGFAVVANEVKELARQTVEATGMISKQVVEIQGRTREAMAATRRIEGVIGGINGLNGEIVQEVEAQGALTQGIARSMSQVAAATREVNMGARELGHAASDVARATAEAAAGSREIAQSCAMAAEMAAQVAGQTGDAKSLATTVLASVERTTGLAKTVRGQTWQASSLAEQMHIALEGAARLAEVIQGSAQVLRQAQSGLEIGTPRFDALRVKGEYLAWITGARLVLASREGRVQSWQAFSSGREAVPQIEPLLAAQQRLESCLQPVQGEADGIAADTRQQALACLDDQGRQLFAVLDDLYLKEAV